MDKKTIPLIFKLDLKTWEPRLDVLNEGDSYKFSIWRPSVFSLIPPGKDFKYAYFSILSVFGFGSFRKLFGLGILEKNNIKVASLLMVPKYYSYPFMGSKDVQMTYVLVKKDFRGQGIGGVLLESALQYLKNYDKVEYVWYVTTDDNIASQKLAKSIGFVYQGQGIRGRNKRLVLKNQ